MYERKIEVFEQQTDNTIFFLFLARYIQQTLFSANIFYITSIRRDLAPGFMSHLTANENAAHVFIHPLFKLVIFV